MPIKSEDDRVSRRKPLKWWGIEPHHFKANQKLRIQM
jgi:hypothetical protein